VKVLSASLSAGGVAIQTFFIFQWDIYVTSLDIGNDIGVEYPKKRRGKGGRYGLFSLSTFEN
jgi:hypothetical protein